MGIYRCDKGNSSRFNHFIPESTHSVVIHDAAERKWLYFREPQQIIEATSHEEVVPGLTLVDSLVQRQGLYAAGFLSYEAAPAFDRALCTRPPSLFPLLWFGLYSKPDFIELSAKDGTRAGNSFPLIPSISRSAYEQSILQIKTFITNGDTYQVNYTFRLHGPFAGDPQEFFLNLVRAQRADYAAYIDTGRYVICSASPELFFQLDGRLLLARPMKGTAARGRMLEEDNAIAQWLHHSGKNRAENVMVVDMIRNDMGRIAEAGSVQVKSLFDIERYPTLWQMTSTVTATTDASLSDIMAALFPSASITGAPKPRTMQIIADLETTPRRIYTGCIGFIAPGRKAQFNVAIRTALIDRDTGKAEYGIGGGIVWDSVSGDEYLECQIKAHVLFERSLPFSLLETMLWTPEEGYFLLGEHLQRLGDSAAYFGIALDLTKVREKLKALADSHYKRPYKVRLFVAQDGASSCESSPFDDGEKHRPVRLRLAPTPVDSSNFFLYHKTTNRRIYDDTRTSCPDCDDVILWNERGEITETCRANIVVFLDGKMLTPRVSCGLLPGTFRTRLIHEGKIVEGLLLIEDLKRSKRIFVINSLRTWRKAVLVE
jgi:para-aminobenzoate synthetase/4-amino-4-deoxychorismate lyase